MIGEDSPARPRLNDLALEVATRATGFQSSLPPSIAAALEDLIRSMNCYYSNLIEGHDTHPIDIERALNSDYSADPEKRDLQLEARAHITVQQWIDKGGAADAPTAPETIREIHRRFCELLPNDMLLVEDPETGEQLPVVAGQLRDRDVVVGRHVAISPGSVQRFLVRLHTAYQRPGRLASILAIPCAHHRLLWVHPFLDGNGRVARLMSYMMQRQILRTKGLWSIARGLARNEAEYKQHLQACDQPRSGDRDGRGNLSEAALASFVEFFLKTCLDQINFMEGLMEPQQLHQRILAWANEKAQSGDLPQQSSKILEALLYRGNLERGDVADLLNASDRTARRITSALIDAGAIRADSSRAPLNLAFPAKLAGVWMPGLFPTA